MPDATIAPPHAPRTACTREPSAEDCRRVLRLHAARAGSAACWAHPSWLAAALQVDPAAAAGVQAGLARRPPSALRACSGELLRHAGIEAPALEVLQAPPARRAAALLGLVPADACRRMLRMRALLGHVDQLRRTIDRATRERLSTALGLPLADFVARAGAAPARAGAIASVDDEALCVAGYRALAAARPAGRGMEALVLPREATLHPAQGAGDGALDATWAALLPDLFPEWAWLFG
jgi:hypothetical protein